MERKEAIRGAYRMTGGKDAYLEKAMSGFPGLETRRNILRLLLCDGRAQAGGLVRPAHL